MSCGYYVVVLVSQLQESSLLLDESKKIKAHNDSYLIQNTDIVFVLFLFSIWMCLRQQLLIIKTKLSYLQSYNFHIISMITNRTLIKNNHCLNKTQFKYYLSDLLDYHTKSEANISYIHLLSRSLLYLSDQPSLSLLQSARLVSFIPNSLISPPASYTHYITTETHNQLNHTKSHYYLNHLLSIRPSSHNFRVHLMLHPFIKFNNTMGNKPSSQINNDYNRLLADYDIIQQTKDQGLRYLEHKVTKQQYLLREISCHDKQSYKKTQLKLRDRKQQLQGNQYIVSLLKLISTEQDQYCMTYFKIYALWEFPQRTLEDEINERILQKRRFEEKELWSILASSILALSHLQKENIKHNALKSAALLITSDGIIKLYDPITIGAASNYEILLTHRSSPHLYLSPQQTESLNQEKSTPSCDPYKSDIWTLGMILLQAGLLCYQDECYRDQFSKIRWQTLNINKNKFQQTYSAQLSNLLEFMLAKDERGRPDWAQLEQHVIRVQQDAKGSNVSQTSMQKNKNSIDRVFEQINPHSKPHLQKKDLSVYFDKKPLSSSRSEQKPNQSFMVVNKIYQNDPQMPSSGYVVRPSDISATRPLRNLFPASTYQTLTKLDENILPQNQKFNLQHQKSAKYHQSNQKNIITHSTINQQKHSTLKEQAEFVHENYAQGSRYQGYKVRGLKHGFGRFYYQDGGMYEGNWQENRMTGYGKLYYQSDKLAYQGQWKNDQFDGQGILYNQYPQPLRGQFNYRNFDEIEQHWTKYQGQFVQDMKHGRGILYLANGEYFQGQFRNDYVQGMGTFVSQRGQQIQGRWQNNLML